MTRKHITDRDLRDALARELAALRRTMRRQKIRADDPYMRGIMAGMDSIAWSLQNARNAERAKAAA